MSDLSILKTYLGGVMRRAECHTSVAEIAPALGGCVLWRADQDSLHCRTYGGKTANILWFAVGGRWYGLAYNHATDRVELSDRLTGQRLYTFNNTTPNSAVLAAFRAL